MEVPSEIITGGTSKNAVLGKPYLIGDETQVIFVSHLGFSPISFQFNTYHSINVSIIIFLILCLVLCLVISTLLIIRIFFCIVSVNGSSMEPTLQAGENILIFRYFPVLLLKKGQIAVFDLSRADLIPYPKPTTVIKRLTGLPGDIVRIHHSQVDQGTPFIKLSRYSEDGYYEMLIPPKHCFVQADGQGSDSRHWGPLPFYVLVGVAIKKISLGSN